MRNKIIASAVACAALATAVVARQGKLQAAHASGTSQSGGKGRACPSCCKPGACHKAAP
ncbi:hypothetical protein [Streptomyces sp. NPDC003006]